MLSDDQIAAFVRDGYVRLDGAFPTALADHCRALLWEETGLRPDQPHTWTEPVAVVHERSDEPFLAAANTPALHAAFDELVGAGRWRPLTSVGWFLIRFPGGVRPPDDGWHVDGSYPLDGDEVYGLNLRSRDQGLLLLFLFSDVTDLDAPTMLRRGSHLDVPRLLEPAGEAGMSDRRLFELLGVTEDRPVSLATGKAGDVYLCHPFLVHTAQPHYGATPRFLAQPGLGMIGDLHLEAPAHEQTPVEAAVCLGLREGVTRS